MPMKFLKGRPLSILENEDRERIRDANPIEQVVGKYVDLVQKGRFTDIRPTHQSHQPTSKSWLCHFSHPAIEHPVREESLVIIKRYRFLVIG